MNREEALERSLAVLNGDTPPPRPDVDDERTLPLTWDGFGYTRSSTIPTPTDAFGTPIPPKPIGPGWYIGSLTLLREGVHDERGGICVDVIDVPDVNGEPHRHYVCVETHRRHVYRLEIHEADIRVASPASIGGVRRTLADAHNACLPKNRALAVCAPGWLATTVIPALTTLQATR